MTVPCALSSLGPIIRCTCLQTMFPLSLLSAQQLPLCLHVLKFQAAASHWVQLSRPTVVQPHPASISHHHDLSTSISSFASKQSSGWLPAHLNRFLRKQQRGQHNYPSTPLQPGLISAIRTVPPHIPRPHYASGDAAAAGGRKAPNLSTKPEIMTDEASRAAMRAVGHLAAQALQLAGSMAVPGTTTDDIDAAVHAFLVENGAYPSPLEYHGFPKSVCTSVNEVVCHGVPDSRPLQQGDVLNVDVTAYLQGFHGDTNATFCVCRVSDVAQELVSVTQQCLQAAIDVCGPGVPFRAIGEAISSVADAAGMYVNRDFVGHGIGRQFHAAPAVHHCRNLRPGSMQLWQTFTIEPIIALGTSKQRTWAADPTGWTCVTPDGSLTAQFEHTVMVNETGVEVLTVC